MKKVSKKTAYNIKEASNPKLKASARKNYAENAEAAMKKGGPKQMAKPTPKATAKAKPAAMMKKGKSC
jgi:hypothetical protein